MVCVNLLAVGLTQVCRKLSKHRAVRTGVSRRPLASEPLGKRAGDRNLLDFLGIESCHIILQTS